MTERYKIKWRSTNWVWRRSHLTQIALRFVPTTWVSIAGDNDRQCESWNIFDMLMSPMAVESRADNVFLGFHSKSKTGRTTRDMSSMIWIPLDLPKWIKNNVIIRHTGLLFIFLIHAQIHTHKFIMYIINNLDDKQTLHSMLCNFLYFSVHTTNYLTWGTDLKANQNQRVE